MSFEPASAKITIASIDAGGPTVTAQYNPKEVQIDLSVNWQPPNPTSGAISNDIALEFTGAQGRTMTVDLLFDGFEDGGKTVAGSISNLQTLASVIDPSSTDRNKRRPYWCSVTWGTGGIPSFRCVIQTLSTKYQMFSTTGKVLRATCTVTLMEANKVSLATPQQMQQMDSGDSGSTSGGTSGGGDGG